MKLRVLSYNIHKGRAFFSRRKKWEFLKQLFENIKPDLIFLQEFLLERETEMLLEQLVESLWPHHSFGYNAVASSGFHYGNAILSRFPFVRTVNNDISNSQLERRGLLYGQIEVKKQPLHLFCCHLDLTYTGRKRQLQKLRTIIPSLAPEGEPLLLAGDFNDWQERLHPDIENSFHVTEAFVSLTGRLQPSSPSVFPLFSLDRVYLRGLEALRGDYLRNREWGLASDHLAALVEVEFCPSSKSKHA